jgi:hypothetical protein
MVISAAGTGTYLDFPATGKIARFSASGRVEPLLYDPFALSMPAGEDSSTGKQDFITSYDPVNCSNIKEKSCRKNKKMKDCSADSI